jgi:hypothetical protein
VSGTEDQPSRDGSEPGAAAGPPGVSKLADPEQTRHRLEILNQFFRGMLLLNGGACVALLAFIQAIWERRPPGFLHVVVYGMAFFLLGLVFSVVSQYARYEISLHSQFRRKRKAKWWRRARRFNQRPSGAQHGRDFSIVNLLADQWIAFWHS